MRTFWDWKCLKSLLLPISNSQFLSPPVPPLIKTKSGRPYIWVVGQSDSCLVIRHAGDSSDATVAFEYVEDIPLFSTKDTDDTDVTDNTDNTYETDDTNDRDDTNEKDDTDDTDDIDDTDDTDDTDDIEITESKSTEGTESTDSTERTERTESSYSSESIEILRQQVHNDQ